MSTNEFDRHILALPGDMIFAARIRGAAQAAGARVTLASNPAELLEKAAADTPARILLDLDARSWDGVDVIRKLKADAATESVEVVAFVSHVREDAIAGARDAGADRVLARGAFMRQLHEWVRLP